MAFSKPFQALQVQFHYNETFNASFSVIHIDASLANAFRRILMAELPTLAIDKIYMHNNTSIIADEILAHRLSLIPLQGSPEGLKWLHAFTKPDPETGEGGDDVYDYNTIVLKLNVECTRNEEGIARGETDPRIKYNNAHIYARDLRFEAVGQQSQYFKDDGIIKAVNPDILIAKLRPGQKIEFDAHCHVGFGQTHAKFSPVAPASYRTLPTITIKRPILGADARKFQDCFPAGVIGLEKVSAAEAAQAGSGYEGHEGKDKAVVKDAFRDTVSRECLRHDEFKDKVKLGRVQDHFIYSVESTGQTRSDELFLDSVKKLKVKARKLREGLEDLMR